MFITILNKFKLHLSFFNLFENSCKFLSSMILKTSLFFLFSFDSNEISESKVRKEGKKKKKKRSKRNIYRARNTIIYLRRSVAYTVNILRIINTEAAKLRRCTLAHTYLALVCARFVRPSVSLSLSSQRKLRLRNH